MTAGMRAVALSRRERRVRDGFARYADPYAVPASVWDAAVAWGAVTGACFADIASDIADVVPDRWDPDDVDAMVDRAVDRMIDDDYDKRR